MRQKLKKTEGKNRQLSVIVGHVDTPLSMHKTTIQKKKRVNRRSEQHNISLSTQWYIPFS